MHRKRPAAAIRQFELRGQEIVIHLHEDWEKRRVPTGFDMSVLYRLLAAEQEAAPERVRRLRFSSRAAFFVRDANGQALACVYFEDEPGQSYGRAPAHRDKPGRIGTNVAKLRTG